MSKRNWTNVKARLSIYIHSIFYETIVKAHEGDPDAINTVLSHYAGYIPDISDTVPKYTGKSMRRLRNM